MKKKSIITLSVVTFGLIIASWAFAQQVDKKEDGGLHRGHPGAHGNPGECGWDGPRHERGGRHGKGDGRFGRHMGPELNLTADQQAKMDKIRAENDKSAEKIRGEIGGLKEKMRAEWKADKPNKQAILGLHKKIAELKNKLAEQRIAERLDIIALLTPDQRAKMVERMEDRDEGRGYHRGFEGRGKPEGRKEGRPMNRGGRGFEDKARFSADTTPSKS